MGENIFQINGGMINACKKRHVCEKDYVWNFSTYNCENGKYLASIMNDSAIICDEVIHAEKKNFIEKNIS